MARLRWNSAELDRLLNSPTGAVGRDLAVRAARVTKRAKELCPVSPHGSGDNQSGHLRSNIGWELGYDEIGLYAQIGSDVEYALVVETGSRPHEIVAKGVDAGGKKALAWLGGVHPVKRVNHPGTEAQPYLRPALLAVNEG